MQQKRLFFLMHETGLVYLDTFENVGEQEHSEQVEKTGNKNQLQRIAKVIMRLSVAMGLEPVGVMAQQCQPESSSNSGFSYWFYAMVFTVLVMVCLGVWFFSFRFKNLLKQIDGIENQLGDHYTDMQHGCVKGLIQLTG